MRPPNLRLSKEDFPGVDWIDRLLRPLMIFAGQTENALTRSLTLTENISSQVLEFTVQMNSAKMPVTLGNGWGNLSNRGEKDHQPPIWRKTPDGFVWVSGAIGLGVAGTAPFALPQAAWPKKEYIHACYASFDGLPALCKVRVDQQGVCWVGEGLGGVADEVFLNLFYEAADLTPLVNTAFPISTKLDLAEPVGVVPLRAVELPSPLDERPVFKALFVDWQVQNDKLVIYDIPGLQPGKKYKVKLLVYGG